MQPGCMLLQSSGSLRALTDSISSVTCLSLDVLDCHHLSKMLGVHVIEQRCHFCSHEGLPALDPDPVSMS